MTLYINTKDSKVVKVEIRDKGKVISSLCEENEHGSQVLLPLILKLLPPRGWDVIEGIEVEEGPGSFTGLRVGASVAQALGLALNIPVNDKLNKPLTLSYT